MGKRILTIIFLFYLLSLLQTSFFPHFNFWGHQPNFILIAVILLNIFNSDIKLGIASSLIGGFFLDIFSNNFFGFWILILLASVLLIQFILKRYVHFPNIKRI